jgi:hypothetical protein
VCVCVCVCVSVCVREREICFIYNIHLTGLYVILKIFVICGYAPPPPRSMTHMSNGSFQELVLSTPWVLGIKLRFVRIGCNQPLPAVLINSRHNLELSEFQACIEELPVLDWAVDMYVCMY